MRTILFKTPPLLAGDNGGLVALVDVDGATPFTLFVENLDQPATFMTVGLFNSKNANLVFKAVSPGEDGNLITVEFTTAPSQPFGITVVGNAITVNLSCDASGFPNSEMNLARNVMDALNEDVDASALIVTSLAPGSDGSGQVDVATGALALAGGAFAVALDSVEVSVSSLPPSLTSADGWVVNTAAGAAFGALGANVVGAYEFTPAKTGATELSVIRGLKVVVTPGPYDTSIVVVGVSKKKSL